MRSWLRVGVKLSSRHCASYHSVTEGKPTLQAIARRKTLAKGAAYHRERGLVSAVIFDGALSQQNDKCRFSTSSLVYLRDDEISSHYKSMGHNLFMSTVFIMHISNSLKMRAEISEEPVLPRTVNFDASGRINNLRFIRAPSGAKLKLNCPIVFLGAKDCLGIQKGGLFKGFYKYLPLFCPPELLPPIIEVNISNLDVGGQFLAEDIKLSVDIHPDFDPKSPICEIINQA
ncbi:hypothetical protein KP509_24G016300 [Ceratopteris richardii]|uniref:Large ribosomal subunit protein bL25 beta domain-containing protein n=1 Tax=Ceratopteris richardii TaxID=49495 RepID=A0A8T2RV58_CERRI|nr:hypothetical protein KP509_24G016300 [Ceratopteris richardii]